MPAWRKVGATAWAAYSRHADLGNGLFLYPFEALGGALLTIAAAVAFFFDPLAPRSASIPIYLAAGLVLSGLLAMILAAPKMLSLRRIGEDPIALQRAFQGFELWGGIRAVFQILALSRIYGRSSRCSRQARKSRHPTRPRNARRYRRRLS
jgi:hypothetical protein